MKINLENPATEARRKLEELGGRTAQDLGLGRIVGQLLVHLYFQPEARSLDQIEQDLGLSKAAVSVAARQLDSMGLIKRVWFSGDKRSYYRTADNIASALGHGLVSMIRRRFEYIQQELIVIASELNHSSTDRNSDLNFMTERIKRMQVLEGRLLKVLNSPILKLLVDK